MNVSQSPRDQVLWSTIEESGKKVEVRDIAPSRIDRHMYEFRVFSSEGELLEDETRVFEMTKTQRTELLVSDAELLDYLATHRLDSEFPSVLSKSDCVNLASELGTL